MGKYREKVRKFDKSAHYGLSPYNINETCLFASKLAIANIVIFARPLLIETSTARSHLKCLLRAVAL